MHGVSQGCSVGAEQITTGFGKWAERYLSEGSWPVSFSVSKNPVSDEFS